MLKKLPKSLVVAIAVGMLCTGSTVMANAGSSSSYILDFTALTDSTAKGSSTTYGLHGATGDTVPGTSSSSSYSLCTAFMEEAYGNCTPSVTPPPPPPPPPTPPSSPGGGPTGSGPAALLGSPVTPATTQETTSTQEVSPTQEVTPPEPTPTPEPVPTPTPGPAPTEAPGTTSSPTTTPGETSGQIQENNLTGGATQQQGQQSGQLLNNANTFTGEVLRSAAEGEATVFRDLGYWLGYMCQGYAYWFWILIAILMGLLISVNMRLHDILRHVPKKIMNDLYRKNAADEQKKRRSRRKRKK